MGIRFTIDEVPGGRQICANSLHPGLAGQNENPIMLRCITSTMALDWTAGPLAEGLRLYDSGEFFAAHEAWEAVWLKAPEPEKTFLQGLIQVTAAFHHWRRGNRLGTFLLLQAALRRLEKYPPVFGGICLKQLCGDIRERMQVLEENQASLQMVSPRIEPS